MKKLFVLLTMVICSWAGAVAQPMCAYDLKYQQGTFTKITDGNVVSIEAAADDFHKKVFDAANATLSDDGTAKGFPIGFNFKYDNQTMTNFLIGSNGFIVLGNKEDISFTIPFKGSFLFGQDDCKDYIGITSDLTAVANDSTEISYKVEGADSEKVLTVQYLNVGGKGMWDDTPAFVYDFQIKLYEKTGEVRLCLNSWKPLEGTSPYANTIFGVKGSVENDLLVISEKYDAPVASPNKIEMSLNNDSYPADGAMYSFFPAEDCAAPATQPSNLVITPGSVYLNGSFDKSETADHYLVLLSKEETLTAMPQDGVYYHKDDSLGNAVVLGCDTSNVFASNTDLDKASTYYVTVMGANTFCMYGPKYNTASPLTAKAATLAARPDTLYVTSTSLNAIVLNAKANKAGNDIIIAVTDKPGISEYGDIQEDGMFGYPSGSLSVGDSIEGGGIIAYKGAAKDGISIENLKSNTIYHFMAWSVDGNNAVSTDYLTVNDVTVSVLPWTVDYDNMGNFSKPIGWNTSEGWQKDRYEMITNKIKCKDLNNGVVSLLETPEMVLSDVENRFIFDLNLTKYERWSKGPYKFADNDTILVQVTEDGKNYITIHEITKKNAPVMETDATYVKYILPFKDLAGKRVRMRISFKFYTDVDVAIKTMKVEEKAECDYPINLKVIPESADGENIEIIWTPQSEETTWEVVCRDVKTTEEINPETGRLEDVSVYGEWKSVIVNDSRCVLTGLLPNGSYEVKVRAYRSETVKSEWSEILAFKSSVGIPFKENFKDGMPVGWTFMQGELTENTELVESSNWKVVSWYRGSYASLQAPSEGEMHEWLVTSKFKIQNKYLKHLLKAAFSLGGNSADKNSEIKVVLAKGDEAFSSKNVIAEISEKDMDYSTISMIDTVLTNYEGVVRMGIYVTNKAPMGFALNVNELSLEYSCVNDIETTVSNVTETSADVEWKSASDTILYYCRENGMKERNFVETGDSIIHLKNLKPHTLYEFGITKMCEVGDTAVVKVVDILTLGKVVPMVEDVRVEVQKYSAKISWTADAYAYNIKYRKESANEWLLVKSDTTFVDITGLLDNTTYEYMIQSVGSKVESDTSEYTPVATFTTLEETCFYPENIVVEPDVFSAAVKWDDNKSAKYEVAYAPADDEKWLSVMTDKNEAVIENLDAYKAYILKVRSFDAEGDSSKWSPMVKFTTLEIPECVTPTDLTVTDVTATSAVLKWTADNSNISWNLKYRKSDVNAWTEANELKETSYKIDDLESEAVYVWRVMAVCEYETVSKWAAQKKFTTLTDGMKELEFSGINVFVKDGTLNVINSYSAEIKSIKCYDLAGNMIASYDVNSTDNILIKTTMRGNVIIRIEGDGISDVKKIYIR